MNMFKWAAVGLFVFGLALLAVAAAAMAVDPAAAAEMAEWGITFLGGGIVAAILAAVSE